MSGKPDFTAIFECTRSLFQQLGIFESVVTHEAKNAPGVGLRVEIWSGEFGIRPIPAQSGLNSTSLLVTLNARIRSDFRAEPMDAIDPLVLDAAWKVVNAFSGNITITGGGATAVDWVDLLGAYSDGLTTRSGYVTQDSFVYRVMDITIPYVIEDSMTQAL